jgi:hypothetical protein
VVDLPVPSRIAQVRKDHNNIDQVERVNSGCRSMQRIPYYRSSAGEKNTGNWHTYYHLWELAYPIGDPEVGPEPLEYLLAFIYTCHGASV